MSTTTNYVRPLNLWEYLDAGGHLADVLGASTYVLAETVEHRSRTSMAKRESDAMFSRAMVEDLLTNGAESRFVPPHIDGTTRDVAEVQLDLWRESFRADVLEASDDQVSILLGHLSAEERAVIRSAPYAPIMVAEPEGMGWQCGNCNDVYEPREARAFVVDLSDGTSLEYCVSCVAAAAAMLGAGTFERGFRAGHALGVKGGPLPEHFTI
jgi:hypothetical protein